MTNEEILKGNKFANMTYDDLQLMWGGLKRFYEYGCFAGDLLRAIACNMFEE
mgnify:CR=1 FL=1